MATWTPVIDVPALIHHRRFARNESLVQANYYRLIKAAQNHVVGHQRKCLCNFSQTHNAISSGSVSDDVPLWRTYIATGYGVDHIEVNLVLLRAYDPQVVGYTPAVYLKLLNPATGATDATSAVVHTGATTDANTGPDSWIRMRLTLDASDATVYWLQLYASNYARVLSMEAHEVAAIPVDDTVLGAVDPRCAVDSPIYDAQMSAIALGQTALLKSNRRHLCSWSAYGASAITNDTATYKNILDGTSTTVTAATPGIYLQNAYCNTAGRTGVPCVFAVYAGATLNGGYMKITDGTNELETAVITTAGWYTVAGLLPAAAATKYDVWQRGHASGGLITPYACALLEYE